MFSFEKVTDNGLAAEARLAFDAERGVYTHQAYKTGSPLQVHFGLGAHDQVNLRISLASGATIELNAVQANRFLDLDLRDATLTEVQTD